MPTVTLYTRARCRLCDDVLEELEALRREQEFVIEQRNIDEDPELRALYNEHVPVVAVDGREVCRHRLDREKVRTALSRGTQHSS